MGARSSKELIDEINIMYNMLEDVDEYTEEQVTSKTTEIKKLFNHFLKEHKIKGTLTESELTAIKNVLLPIYKDMKSYPAINEVLEQIGDEYEYMIEDYEEEEENETKVKELRKTVLGIRVKTLGNPGSRPETYSASELEKIIRAKIDETGINNVEIVNILNACVGRSEEYQELVENIVIPSLDSYLKTGQPKITNVGLLPVIKEYALGYLQEGNIEKCREIIRKGLKIKGFESMPQYQELRDAFPKDEATSKKEKKGIDPEELRKKGFEGIDVSDLGAIENEEELFAAFFERLKILPAFIDVFSDDTPKGTRIIKNHITKNPSIISREEKLRNIFKILRGIQKEYPDANITKAYVGKEAFVPQEGEKNSIKSFENYVIFEVDNTDHIILENFDDGKEGKLFIVPAESLQKIVSMKRTDAAKEPEVEFVIHRKNEKNGTATTEKPKDHYYVSIAVDKLKKCLEKQANRKRSADNQPTGRIELEHKSQQEDFEGMSTQDLIGYLSKLDKDIEEANAENVKIQEEVDAVVSDEANLRKSLIESIRNKQQELQSIRGEQQTLKNSLQEKQKMIDDAKKKVFGVPGKKDGEEGPDGH